MTQHVGWQRNSRPQLDQLSGSTVVAYSHPAVCFYSGTQCNQYNITATPDGAHISSCGSALSTACTDLHNRYGELHYDHRRAWDTSVADLSVHH